MIPWNFAKFLVNSDGQVVRYLHSKQDPNDLRADIEKLLNWSKHLTGKRPHDKIRAKAKHDFTESKLRDWVNELFVALIWLKQRHLT